MLFWTVVGTTFSWRKTCAGLSHNWVGYWLDRGRFGIGISDGRRLHLLRDLERVLHNNVVQIRELHKMVGRLGLAAAVCTYVKPVLACPYACVRFASQGACLPLPSAISATFCWIRDLPKVRSWWSQVMDQYLIAEKCSGPTLKVKSGG